MKIIKKLVVMMVFLSGIKEVISDSWTTKTNMPTARWGFAIGVVNDKIDAIGGYNLNFGGYLSTNEGYTPDLLNEHAISNLSDYSSCLFHLKKDY